jgi:hypothetical protein
MTQADQLVHSIELPESIIGLRKDGIVHVFIKPFMEITTEYQERQLAVLNEITGNKKHPTIYEAGENVTVGTETRTNAKILEAITPTLCKVVFVRTLAHKLISEFYYKFNKPEQPYKVFTDFEAGIKWLLETKKQLESKQ